MFTKRLSLVTAWQDIADNFYPERADFTVSQNLSFRFADNLTTSYPVIVRREFGDTIEYMMRPYGVDWFGIETRTSVDEDNEAKKYLERNTKIMRRAMFDPVSQFKRTMKMTDHDLAAFGQGVAQVEYDRDSVSLLYRNWHLRDVVWCQNARGVIDTVFRRFKMSVRELNKYFKGNISPKLKIELEKDKYREIDCLHVEMPSEDYIFEGGKKTSQPVVSLFIDIENQFVMEQTGIPETSYVIPRWILAGQAPYAISPAIVAALPDARLIQAMSLVILDAGEKSVNPPIIYQDGVLRGDLNMYAGGATAVDPEYDEAMGEAVRAIQIDRSGIQHGLLLRADIKEALRAAFYLDKLDLPPAMGSGDMTATEVMQRVQAYIRQAGPLFDPMEEDYNGQLCLKTYNLLNRNFAFGPPDEVPDSLKGKDIHFAFKSPLTETVEQKKGQLFIQAQGLLAQVANVDPGAVQMFDFRTALRDAWDGLDVPASWVRSEAQMEELNAQQAEAQQAKVALEAMGAGAEVAQKVGDAGQSLQALGQGGF